MVSEQMLFQTGQTKKQSVGIKSYYSNTSYGLEYEKKCISKFSIKKFIKN